jgi:predicted acyl esterase
MNGSTRSRSAERPSALKAVIAIYASDDRYTDDVHDTGGS